MTELRDLLDLATDRVEAPGGAAAALGSARRRRTARRSLAATATVVVLVTGVALAGRIGGDRTVEPAPAPTSSPTTVVPVAPAIPRSAVHPVWDPRGAEGLPVVELGVPRVMESLTPGTVTRPVAVLDDGSRAVLVSGDGYSEELTLPDGLGGARTVTISPDGQRLVAAGASGFFWRDLDGEWREVDGVPGEARLTWLPDSSGVVARGWPRAVRVDLDGGTVEDVAYLEGVSHIGFGPDGRIVGTEPQLVVEWGDGEEVGRFRTGELEGLILPAVGNDTIAFTRANLVLGDQPADRDGLVAVDRETLETRAYLPVPDDHDYYAFAEELRPLTWLSDDVLAFTVLPEGAPKEYLVTWNAETGELSRVSCWLSGETAVFATDLLGRS
ncbi:hypothetical protein [Nocardioides sp. SR21]|uniref:hypothetical protein n=1 Tax=Nocardioides sp. SR21 TaxID=2919501 RepID=UPI001FA96D37|nr:hypothetical protein [Nocardioides sp. SR21]